MSSLEVRLVKGKGVFDVAVRVSDAELEWGLF